MGLIGNVVSLTIQPQRGGKVNPNTGEAYTETILKNLVEAHDLVGA